MTKASNVFFFLLAIGVSSFGLQHLTAMADETRIAAHSVSTKQVILGHRVGPMGQVMLVSK